MCKGGNSGDGDKDDVAGSGDVSSDAGSGAGSGAGSDAGAAAEAHAAAAVDGSAGSVAGGGGGKRQVQMRGVGASAEIDIFPLIDSWARLARRLGVDMGRPGPPSCEQLFSPLTGELARPSDLMRLASATSSVQAFARVTARTEFVESLRTNMKAAFRNLEASSSAAASAGGAFASPRASNAPTSAAGRLARARSMRAAEQKHED